MPEPRGLEVLITCFVDANHAGDRRDRKSQTDVLLFINKVPIHWYSKAQSTVEASIFGAEFCAMKTGVEMIEALRYKLHMFGISINILQTCITIMKQCTRIQSRQNLH